MDDVEEEIIPFYHAYTLKEILAAKKSRALMKQRDYWWIFQTLAQPIKVHSRGMPLSKAPGLVDLSALAPDLPRG